MKKALRYSFILRSMLCVLCILYAWTASAGIVICTWNLENFGRSKSPQEMRFIARTLRSCDIIAIEEVVAGTGGKNAVVRLAACLNEGSGHWRYMISAPTTGSPYQTERYAFVWRADKVSCVGKGWLDKTYQDQIEREPYMATFSADGKDFTLVTFHAVPKSRQPEHEIKYFKFFPARYPSRCLLFMGDFNCPQTNNVFNPLKKMGYRPVLAGQKTTLRQKCIRGDCLASAYDNIFYPAGIQLLKSGIIAFYRSFADMKAARKISDHVPVVAVFDFTGSEVQKRLSAAPVTGKHAAFSGTFSAKQH